VREPSGGDPRHPGEPDAGGSDLTPAEALQALRLPRDDASSTPGGRDRRRRLLRWLAAGVLLLAGAALLLRLLTAGPLEVRTAAALRIAQVADEPIPVLSGSGYVVPAQPTIAIGSRVAGRIERYRVEEGDRVKPGDPLVELDARPFRAAVEEARASLASARARARLAESELRRARKLFEADVLPRDTLDQRESEARVARASVAQFESALTRGEIDLEDTVIRAPTGGVVLETLKQPGEVAVPGGFAGSGDLLRLANLEEIRAELDVNESDLPQVYLGQDAEIVPDAFPDRRYAGRVVELAPQIDRQKGTREVEVRVLEPDDRLLPDMSVRVVFLKRISADEAAESGATLIPRAALRRDEDGRSFVWVVRDGRAQRVSVEAGQPLGDRVIVRAGLDGGERLVVGAAPEREGQRVTPLP
jgi:RND family efflux transporter MFP subunit